MSYIPIFTPGMVGVPSTKVNVNSIKNPVFVSSYSGEILPGQPKFSTPTDDRTGKNKTFHGGILIGDNTIVCHNRVKKYF
jgi:hypothetical protein